MASDRQEKANRQNAQKSTGPKTPQGKARSSRNALKHGILSEHTVVQGEDRQAFEAFRARMVESLQPVGAMEELLAGRIVDCGWRLQRFLRFQGKTLDRALQELTDKAVEFAEDLERHEAYEEAMAEEDEDSLTQTKRDCIVDAIYYGINLDAEDLEDPPEALDAFWACSDRMEVLSRYETTLERRMVKALHELQRLQAARQNGPAPAPRAFDYEVEVTGGGNGEG